MKLSTRVAIVTGGGRGIGQSIALEFAKNGVSVCVVDILRSGIDETVGDIVSRGGKALGIVTDVSQDKQVKEMVERVLDKFKKIDILVNCAGIARYNKVIDLSEEDWDAVMNVNAKGVFLCCRAVAPHMIERRRGKIISLASREGKTAHAYLSAYCASKAAVILFTESLALELAPYHINVNTICPGVVLTDMIRAAWGDDAQHKGISVEQAHQNMAASVPLGRLGKPEEIARLALFLASEDSDYITGQAYNIGGGVEFH